MNLQSLHIPMLDWTTSFLSDETIIKPRRKSVKHFLDGYYIHAKPQKETLPVGEWQENAPQFLRGIDENQEATPVALEDHPYCQPKKQFGRQPQVVHNAATTTKQILFLEGYAPQSTGIGSLRVTITSDVERCSVAA